MDAIINRYDRQELIDGWDQKKLQESSVAVIGSGIAANLTSVTLAALGFGDIRLYGAGKSSDVQDFSMGFATSVGVPRVKTFAEFASKVNPYVKVKGVSIDVSSEQNVSVVGKPEIIIDTTNDPRSKLNILEYSSKNKVPFISIAASEVDAALGISKGNPDKKYLENLLFADFSGQKQGVVTSQVISALACEESRKIVMPLVREQKISDIIVYNLNSSSRFDWKNNSALGSIDMAGKTVLQVGTGAEGTFSALDFALSNLGKLILVDYDTIEETNLNRQILFYEAVGRKKVTTLGSRLRKLNPNSNIETIDAKVTPDSEALFSGVDLIVDCVDNHKTRALLNYFSQKLKIPYISGGTNFAGGQVTTVVPGKTACLNCQTGIDEMALAAYSPVSCIYAPEPSVIVSNEIMGAMIVGEAFRVLNGSAPLNSIMKYSSKEELRFGLFPTSSSCNCYKAKGYAEGWMKKMEHIYR